MSGPYSCFSALGAVGARVGTQVFYPEGERWAEEVIEECAAFPFGEHDDYVDSTTQAVLRYRKGNFVSLFSDEPDEIKDKGERMKEIKFLSCQNFGSFKFIL